MKPDIFQKIYNEIYWRKNYNDITEGDLHTNVKSIVAIKYQVLSQELI